MDQPSNYSRPDPKIHPGHRPAQSLTRPDGSPVDNDRVEIGPTQLAFDEWEKLGLTPPNLDRMRAFRLKRLCAELQKRDYGAALFFDPLNIRYATDSTNMQLWVAHNPSRACFVSADGYMVLWDFHGCSHLSSYLSLINETRDGGAAFFYFTAGDKMDEVAKKFAGEVDELMRAHCGGNRRIAVDKIEVSGYRALEALGMQVGHGQVVSEHARAIKGEDEINAMKCACATCEISVGKMHEALEPGITENDLWSVLHAENIRRGGEWIETRILSSGQRTNPWMQESGPRIIQNGDILAFDTDLVGPYGMCCDMSRTWLTGDKAATDEQKRVFNRSVEHIKYNTELLKPGISFTEITQKSDPLPEEFVQQRYGVMMHGVGLCDEYPAIKYPQDYVEGAFEYICEPGMMLCVEVYFGEVGGEFGVKLEEQVLITEDGYEMLTHYGFDERLMG